MTSKWVDLILATYWTEHTWKAFYKFNALRSFCIMRIKRRCNVQKHEYDLGATTYPIVLHTHITSHISYTLYAYIITSEYYHSNTKSLICFACYLPIPSFCLITEPLRKIVFSLYKNMPLIFAMHAWGMSKPLHTIRWQYVKCGWSVHWQEL